MPKITKIQDNIVTIEGKYKYKQEQIFKLSPEVDGLLLSATPTEAYLLVMGDPSKIKTKSTVTLSKRNINEISVYEGYFGSIISPFGDLLHSNKKAKGKFIAKNLLDATSPAILERVKLSDPIETGILSIDTMIPIGKGQRELIIGDRTTGKTSIALSTIINQKNKGVKSIYVSVGQKRNSAIASYNTLKKFGAHEDAIFIFSNPDSSSQQFLAPKIGMAMAEALAYQGNDVLIVIDDLSKHANVYREISLSIGKNPGREAYPTDIFYQHSRLLERAGKFNKNYKNGTITCLPIVETVKEDIASLLPSNIISITDGQIFTSPDLFNNGIYPAINIGMSVSRTGSAVQTKKVKEISKGLKAIFSNLSEIKKFADMSIDLSPELSIKIDEWKSINTMLMQFGYLGYSSEQMEIMIELFKMNKLADIKNQSRFSVAFKNYCTQDKGAKKLIKELKDRKLAKEEFRKAINAVFIPLVKASSGLHDDIITKQELVEYMEVN